MKLFQNFLLILLLSLYAFFLFQPINLAYVDLGRHIQNGQEILNKNFDVLSKNYYSYVLPEIEFINHHWLAGVIFYLIFDWFGFEGLHFFHSFQLLFSFFLFIKFLEKLSSHKVSILLAIPLILFWSGRTEIRPESFGYLFIINSLIIYFLILKKRIIEKKYLAILLAQQLLWVNLHISFIYGIFLPALLGLVELTKIIKKDDANRALFQNLVILVVMLVIVSLANPNFIAGLISPLTIFSNYGYRVAENQNLWFLMSRIQSSTIYLYFFLAPVIISFLIFQNKIIKKKFANNLYWIALAWIGLLLGFIALRNIIIFSIFVFPFLAIIIQELSQKTHHYLDSEEIQKQFWIGYFILFFSLIVFVVSGNYQLNRSIKTIGIGLKHEQSKNLQNIEKALSEANIDGNIFNNYDLGSLLIYKLFPKYKVFVDNRPEAYTEEFFKYYIDIQENEEAWIDFVKKYNIEAIVFGYNDVTPWAREFMHRILQNKNWKQAYLDEEIIVLIKNEN